MLSGIYHTYGGLEWAEWDCCNFLMPEETEKSMSHMMNFSRKKTLNGNQFEFWWETKIWMREMYQLMPFHLLPFSYLPKFLSWSNHWEDGYYCWPAKYVLGISAAPGIFHICEQVSGNLFSLLWLCIIHYSEYFNSNWHPIRQQWTMAMKYNSGNFLATINN